MNYLHNDTQVIVKLYGKLGKLFGREHRLYVQSTSEALSALCKTLDGFEKYLINSRHNGVGYVCFVDSTNLTQENLVTELASGQVFKIAPVVLGSKRNGLGQVLLGAAIVVAAVWTGGAAAAAAGGAAGGAGTAAAAGTFLGVSGGYAVAAQLGVSMMLGGIVQALSPQQRGTSTADGPDNGASYNFNGTVNTTAQNNPVPLGYGEMTVGSATISAGLYTEDQA